MNTRTNSVTMFSITSALAIASGIAVAVAPRASTLAQQGRCGTVLTPQQARLQLERGPIEYPFEAPRGALSYWYIPIKVHIVSSADGSDALSTGALAIAVVNVNLLYEQWNVFAFQYGTIDYIQHDDLAEVEVEDGEHDALLSLNNYPDVVNVYFVPALSVSTCNGGSAHGQACEHDTECPGDGFCDFASLCGLATFSSDLQRGVIVENGCSQNLSTLSHELGHYFDLYHTHESAFGVECPDGSNCSTAGDLVCDTAADPSLSGHVSANTICHGGSNDGLPCANDSNCPNGSCEPACLWDGLTCDSGADQGMPCSVHVDCDGGLCTAGATPPPGCGLASYVPDPHNIMSYSAKVCRDVFTGGQSTQYFDTWMFARNDIFNVTHYVESGAGGNGTPYDPYGTLAEGVIAADAGDHVFIEPGTYPESMIIDTPMRIWKRAGSGGVVRIGISP